MTVEAKLRITPQLEAAVAGLRGLAREVRALESGVQSADRGTTFKNTKAAIQEISDRLGALHTQLLAFFGLQQGIEGAVAIARMADDYNSLNARLRIVTASQQEFNQALGQARALSTQYSAPLSATAALYTRILSAVRPLGGGVREATIATEAMLASLKISGATAEESASAILQYSQAIGSGVLRGEEFNAVNEAAPRLLDALAAGLGKPKSELKALAEQGQLTTSSVIAALSKQLPQLKSEAAQLGLTISGGAQQARDALQQFVGQETQGSARAIADVLKLIAQNIQQIATALTVLATVVGASALARMTVSFGSMAVQAVAAGGAMGTLTTIGRVLLGLVGGPTGLIVTLGLLAAAWLGVSRAKGQAQDRTIDQIRQERQAVLDEIDALRSGKSGNSSAYLSNMIEARQRLRGLDAELQGANQKQLDSNYRPRSSDETTLRDPAAIKSFETEYKLRTDIVKKYADERANYIKAKDKEIAAARGNGDQAGVAKLTKDKASYLKEQARTESETLKTFDTRDAVTRLAQAKQLYDKDLELLTDSVQREKKILQEKWDDGLVGLKDYLAEKARLTDAEAQQEIQRLQAQRTEEQRALTINQARLRIAKDPNAREQAQEAVTAGMQKVATLDAEIEKKERDRVDAQRQIAIEARNVTREIEQQSLSLDAENRSANGTDTPDAIAARVRKQMEQQRKMFVAQGGSGDLFDQNVDIKVRQAQLQLVQQQLQSARTALDQAEQAVQNQQSAGNISTEEAEARILQLRRDQLPALQAIALQLKQLAVSPDEQARARAAELENERLGDLRSTVEKTLTENARSGLGQLFVDIASGAKTAGDALRNMVASFAQQMLNLIGQRLGNKLFDSLGLSKGIDSATSFITSTFGFHSGGLVSASGATFTRSMDLSPLAVAMAPRYHSGGIVGLEPNERLAVLEDGEEVLTADDPRHVRNYRSAAGGVQTNTSITINGATGDRGQQQGAAEDLQRLVNSAIDTWALRQSRPGGILAGK